MQVKDYKIAVTCTRNSIDKTKVTNKLLSCTFSYTFLAITSLVPRPTSKVWSHELTFSKEYGAGVGMQLEVV